MKSSFADIPRRNRAVLCNECARTSLLATSRFRPAFTVEGSWRFGRDKLTDSGESLSIIFIGAPEPAKNMPSSGMAQAI
jgi:hypothetical protein